MIQTPFDNGNKQQWKQLRDADDGNRNENENENEATDICDWHYVMAEIR